MRPCPYVSCKHHLYLDVNPETGSIKLNFPDLEVWEMAETCSLDVADRGGITLEEVGEILNLTRERIRQVEVRGLLEAEDGRPRRRAAAGRSRLLRRRRRLKRHTGAASARTRADVALQRSRSVSSRSADRVDSCTLTRYDHVPNFGVGT